MEPYDPLSYDHLAESVVRTLLECETTPLPPTKKFPGAGVYAIYYSADFDVYQPISSDDCEVPIYVGKAIFAGSRTGKVASTRTASPLFNRIRQHERSIITVENLRLEDFKCRYLSVKEVWIKLAEEFLVKRFLPVWNVVIDGFGNHNPGKGRKDMIRPKWDTLHPGRHWAEKLRLEHSAETIAKEVKDHFEKRRHKLGL